MSVKHPFQIKADALPDNCSLAKFRLSNLENCLEKNTVSLENYNNIIKYNLNERIMELINPIQDGGGAAPSLYQFSPCNSPKVEISPQNFLTFSFNPFLTLL